VNDHEPPIFPPNRVIQEGRDPVVARITVDDQASQSLADAALAVARGGDRWLRWTGKAVGSLVALAVLVSAILLAAGLVKLAWSFVVWAFTR
jgi:hypothetical protein